MRNDVREGVILHLMSDTKPNFAALAKRYNCDYRIVKRYYDFGLENKLDSLNQGRKSKPGLLDDFKELIIEKLNLGCSAKSIYYLIYKKVTLGVTRQLNDFIGKNEKIKFIRQLSVLKPLLVYPHKPIGKKASV